MASASKAITEPSASASKALTTVPKIAITLKNIDESDVKTSVMVKVLRKWSVYGRNSNGKPTSVELVLCDTQGTKIQGHIDYKHVYKHAGVLHEGKVYTLSRFEVGPNVGVYRATRHDFRLNIVYNTIIRPAARSDLVFEPAFLFTPPDECFHKDFNRDYLVDVAGVLVDCNPIVEFDRGNGKSLRMKIDLDNRGYQFQITLFGEYVQQLSDFVKSGPGELTVLALLWCKVDHWRGSNSIQTTMHTTKLLINPEIAETSLLRESLAQPLLTPTLTISNQKKTEVAKDNFLAVDARHTVAMVKDSSQGKYFVLLATVDMVVNEKTWWYWSCNRCHKKVEEDSEMWYCKICDIHHRDVTRKYLLKLQVSDESDAVTVVLFDATANDLIGQSVVEVHDCWNQDPKRDSMPKELSGLNGKEVLMKLECDGHEESQFGRQYRVQCITAEKEMIHKYLQKWIQNEDTTDPPSELLLLEDTPIADSPTLPKNGSDVSQDLIGKFDRESADSNTPTDGKESVDITKDADDTPPMKKNTPIGKSSSSTMRPLKKIKKEK